MKKVTVKMVRDAFNGEHVDFTAIYDVIGEGFFEIRSANELHKLLKPLGKISNDEGFYIAVAALQLDDALSAEDRKKFTQSLGLASVKFVRMIGVIISKLFTPAAWKLFREELKKFI